MMLFGGLMASIAAPATVYYARKSQLGTEGLKEDMRGLKEKIRGLKSDVPDPNIKAKDVTRMAGCFLDHTYDSMENFQ
jgi:hypothetical protein